MAIASESKSLDEIRYKSKINFLLFFLILPLLFFIGFASYYPLGEKVKGLLKANLAATGCNADFSDIQMNWFLPKIIISEVTVPASCLGRAGDPLEFEKITLNWNLINFSPIGLPFLLETEISGQNISIHYVVGINQQLIRMRDQEIVMSRLRPVLGNAFKLAGRVTIDLNLMMSQNLIKSLALKAQSKNFQIPSQSIQGFTLPNLSLNDFYLEANSEGHPRINVDRLMIGDPESPIRANFKGNLSLEEGNIAFSPMDLSGEIAFSDSFKETLPLIDMMFQSFNQKDGFYQVRLGGTLGAPKPLAP